MQREAAARSGVSPTDRRASSTGAANDAMRRNGAPRRRLKASGDADRLDVHKFLYAVARQLAAVAGLADAAERQARVGLHHVVDGDESRVEVGRDALGARDVGRPDRRAEAELG